MRQLAVVDVHLAELSAAVERRYALAGIEQRLRIERGLHSEEALELAGAELHAHLRQLLDADAVLAGDRAADLDAELQDRGAERLGALGLALGDRVEQDQGMQVAVARVEHVRAAKAVLAR